MKEVLNKIPGMLMNNSSYWGIKTLKTARISELLGTQMAI